MKISHRTNEEKALEALVYVASKWPGIIPFFLAKTFYFAEKDHINRYGRPIIADSYIAMEHGPVPSRIRDYIEGSYLFFENAEDVPEAISVTRSGKYNEINALRHPRMEFFSKTDIECLDSAIAFCKGKSFPELKRITHSHKAYKESQPNSEIDYELFIDDDNPHRSAIIAEAIEYSSFKITI